MTLPLDLAVIDLTPAQFLAKRLREHRRPAASESRADLRAAILAGGLEWTIISTNPLTKKPETYAAYFERQFREPLQPHKGKRHAETAK